MLRIGSGSITTLTSIIRTTSTRRNTTKADRTCTIVIRRKCGFPPTIRHGSIFIRRNGVITPDTILDWIFSSALLMPKLGTRCLFRLLKISAVQFCSPDF